jgi:pyruvate carboxylase subunit B
MAVEYIVRHGERDHTVTVLADSGARVVVQVGDQVLDLAWETLPDGRVALSNGSERRTFRTFRERDRRVVVVDGAQFAVGVADARSRWLRGAGGAGGNSGGRIAASMPGRVVRVPVKVGDVVPPGGVVAVLEAMKMENDVKAPGGGNVVAVAVQEGAAVEAGALLVQLEP